jgi:hypothetical protein
MANDQLPLTLDSPASRAVARRTDPETSHEAAAAISASRTLTLRQNAVLAIFQQHLALTDSELLERYEWERAAQRDERTQDRVGVLLMPQSPSGLRTRRHELVVAGKLRQVGKRRIGERSHLVWGLG